MKLLEVDDKWSIAYWPEENDRPTHWYRYGEMHSSCDFNNPCLAMFYSLLETKQRLEEIYGC